MTRLLEQALQQVEKLSASEQDAAGAALIDYLAHRDDMRLSDAQLAEVRRRRADPNRKLVSHEERGKGSVRSADRSRRAARRCRRFWDRDFGDTRTSRFSGLKYSKVLSTSRIEERCGKKLFEALNEFF